MRQDGMTVGGPKNEGQMVKAKNKIDKMREMKNSIMPEAAPGEGKPIPESESEKSKLNKPKPEAGANKEAEAKESPTTRALKQIEYIREMKKASEEAIKEIENKQKEKEIKDSLLKNGLA